MSFVRICLSARIAGASEDGGQEKHRLIGHEGSTCTHSGGRNAVADRGEARIAPQPRAECGVPDKPEADRGDDGPQHAARRGVKDTGSHYDREIGPDRERKRAQTNRSHREPRNQPRRTQRIDQRAAGHLAGQGDEPARGQDQADIELRPLMRREIDRNERAEPGLDVGEEEGEQV